jgi:hypothetical protein
VKFTSKVCIPDVIDNVGSLIVALALTLHGYSTQNVPPPIFSGRVYTSPTLHVGVLPSVDIFGADVNFSLSVRVSTMLL